MWFKNLQLYRLATPFELSADQLAERLGQHPFRPCGNLDASSRGWVPPTGGEGGPLVRRVGGRLMMALRTEDKLLPASVVRRVVAERVAELEQQHGSKPGGKRKREIRDQVIDELLPRAFTRLRTAFAYIDPAAGWLMVDAATPKRAEEMTALLLTDVDGLQLRPPRVNESPAVLMTEWLNSGEAPAGFTLDTECELASPEDGGAVVRCSRQNLEADEIRMHVTAGKRAVKLAMTWADRISFVLTEQLDIKRLGFLDILQEEAADSGGDGGEEQFDADFAIVGGELARFIPALLDALGGEAAEPV